MVKISINNLMLAAIFLSPCADIFIFYTGYYDLKLLPLLWSFIFGVVLVQKAVRKDIAIPDNRDSNAVFALYALVLVLSCLFSININMSLKELIQYLYLFIIMYITFIKVKDKYFLNKVINAIVKSNIFLVTIALASYFLGRIIIPSFSIYPNGAIFINASLYKTQALVDSGELINRMSGVLGLGPISIANLTLVQSLFVNYMIRKTDRRKILYIFLLVADFATINLTYSRAAILLFLIVHLITCLNKNHVRNIALIFFALCGMYLFLLSFPYLQERILEAFNPQEGSTKYHFAVWIATLKTGYDHIFTGIGLGNMAYNYGNFSYLFKDFGLYEIDAVNVHNFILQIWAEQGIIGLIINLVFIFGPVTFYIKQKLFNRQQQEKSLYDFIMLSYVTTLLYNLTNNNFYIEIFWILAALVYAGKRELINSGICEMNFKLVEERKDNFLPPNYEKLNF